MADDYSASIIPLHQPKRPMTPAERARKYRLRKKGKAVTAKAVAAVPAVTPTVTRRVTPSNGAEKINMASIMLMVAAVGLATVGLAMNGWYAQSQGSSATAGWLFLAIGVAADLSALAVPSCAASLWQSRRRATAAMGWAVWSATFAFAVMASVGFASTNLSDVTASRASRITPAIETAKTSLSDAMTSRDRECKGGVGRFCREREAAVTERRQALDAAMKAVELAADPQVEAASKAVAWLTVGLVKPSGDDLAMIRLLLLTLLPQAGGILLMVARPQK